MMTFTCLSVSPIALAHPGLAVATIRAGGVGILDREFCAADRVDLAQQNLEKLIALTPDCERVGLRLRADQVATSEALLLSLPAAHWLVISAWDMAQLPQVLAQLPMAPARQLLLEVTTLSQAIDIATSGIEIAGLVARGHESGGWVGEDPAFILTQRLIEAVDYPLYIQGGIGMHTAAACRIAGAAGVVLDDQLWLMPESPLPEKAQRLLKNLNGQEAIIIGERLDKGCRVLSRPGFTAITELQKLADQWELTHGTLVLEPSWQPEAEILIGWSEPGVLAWPMGQAVGLAAQLREIYKTTGRLVQAILKSSRKHIQLAKALQPLAPGTPLARSHKTTYPIVQGPMTRVSDKAEFAEAVCTAGGLPLLALALLRGPQVQTLLEKAQELMGGRSWGVGILGFVPHALREEQIKVVRAIKPPFALIAGGRPDQAAQLEAEGIASYIHVPTPSLLKMFIEQGAHRFVFEGRECGGHVGPLSSFLLWESMIDMLLAQVPKGEEAKFHILFAGGIHDALSASMVSAMAAPLAERGMCIGVLMGTVYLFTQEIVEREAIVKGYQDQALACTNTINLETGPGHASRCVVTPFAREFYDTRRRMLLEGSAAEDVKNTLEDLTLGRLRIASKGMTRNEAGKIVEVAEEKQISDGMYMIGQVATMRAAVCTVAELHQNVCEAGTARVLTVDTSEPAISQQPSDIAIVGIGTLLPKAQAPEEYWQNILNKVNAITEIPRERWDWRLYFDEDRKARDKIYSKWGGFIEDIPFDPLRFGIPPRSLKSIDPIQLLALEAVRQALDDAGYGDGDFDRENTSVILGAATGAGDLGHQYATRSHLPTYIEKLADKTWDRLPEWTEESFPGLLLNVAAGRVANRFDFGGRNYTIDAACASSLAAMSLAIEELETGRSNVVITGGVDTGQSPFAYLSFCKTQALSPRQQPKAFDKTTDGIVISEGIAIVVLKRLADAERDGDKIYAVIKAMTGSSDGKALGMTAPRPVGQMRALDRAYEKAGFSPNTLGLYEAHGTGTAVGDRAEAETIYRTLLAHDAAPKSCAIGSVKTVIGHTKSCAGVAALVKAALALHHKVQPPHLGVETPLDSLADPTSPLYLLKEARPWFAHPDHPRRSAASAFGFGGTNFHGVLEEYQGALKAPVSGAETWPQELLVLKSTDRPALIKDVNSLLTALTTGAEPHLADLAYSYALQAQERASQSLCLSLVVSNLTQLQESLVMALAHLEQSKPLPIHVLFSENAAVRSQPIAFIFPGQGAQYPDMAREAALYFPEMREAIEMADVTLRDQLPKFLSQLIYPPSAFTEEEEKAQIAALMETQVAQPALGAIASGFLDLMTRLGIAPAMACGHSYGEYAALHAAGVLTRYDFLKLSATRGQVMASVCKTTEGAMAAVRITRETLLKRLEGRAEVVLANHNAPDQSVISGSKEAVKGAVAHLKSQGVRATMLSVAGAFHTPFVEAAQAPLAEAIGYTAIAAPQIPVYGNSTAKPYPSQPEAVREQLAGHLLSSVEFVSQINAMYSDGARIFLELGPKSVLTKLVSLILEGQEHTSVALDGNGGGIRGFLIALGKLATHGVALNLIALHTGRKVQALALPQLAQTTRKSAYSTTTWMINGGSARPWQQSAAGYFGKLPPLDQEMVRDFTDVPNTHNSHAHSSNGKPTPVSPNGLMPLTSPLAKPAHPVVTAAVPAQIIPSTPRAMTPQTPNAQPAKSGSYVVPATGHAALAGYQAYQETMRQFLTLQERVMQQFLSGVQGSVYVPMEQPLLTNGNGSSIAPAVSKAVPAPVALASVPVAVAPMPVALIPAPVAPTPAPVAVAATNALPERSTLIQILLNLVSDRTGYPAEMLGLDQDMEAELGIDSIKRVEVFGALQKSLAEPLASKIQEEMETFTQVKTLNGVVDALLTNVKAPMPAVTPVMIPPTPTPAPVAVAATNALPDRPALIQILLNLVSDRTGYPAEMLGLDQDMEAELGIDSIKRVEVFGALQKSLPEPFASKIQEQMETFTQVKTLNGVVDALLTGLPAAPAVGASSLGKN